MADEPTIEGLISYLANMTFLLDYHQKLGGKVNRLIAKEFQDGNDRLLKMLEEKFQ